MRKLVIIDDFCNTSFKVSFQKDAKVLDVSLFSHIGNQALMNGLQKWGLIFMDIELFVVKGDQLIIEASISLVQINKFVGRAKKEWVMPSLYYQIDIALNFLQLCGHQ